MPAFQTALPLCIPAVAPVEHGENRCKLWITEQGEIVDCCRHVEALFGYREDELKGRHVSLLLPALAGIPLLQDGRINPRLAFRSHCAIPFRMATRDGIDRLCTLFLNVLTLTSGAALVIIVHTQPSRSKA